MLLASSSFCCFSHRRFPELLKSGGLKTGIDVGKSFIFSLFPPNDITSEFNIGSGEEGTKFERMSSPGGSDGGGGGGGRRCGPDAY